MHTGNLDFLHGVEVLIVGKFDNLDIHERYLQKIEIPYDIQSFSTLVTISM